MTSGLPKPLIILLLAALARTAAGQTTFTLPDTLALGQAERDLLRFEQALSTAFARHDTAALHLMYADEFRGITPTGLPVDRNRMFGVSTVDDPAIVFTVDEIAARILDSRKESAILTGRLTARGRAGDLRYELRFIHVYVWRGGRWQILAAQGTLIPRPDG